MHPNTSSAQCVCALHEYALPPYPTSYHLSPELTISPHQAKGSCLINGDSFQIQNIKNYYRLLSLLPAGTNHSCFIALTRKLITPSSHCSNVDACSQHIQGLTACSSPASCLCCISRPCRSVHVSLSQHPLPACQQTALSSHSASVCVNV